MEEVTIQINTRLDAPELPTGHRLRRIVDSALKNRPGFHNTNAAEIFWPASHFRLDRVSFFCESSEEERRAILRQCSQNVLAESYYIEKSGMYFASKMCLLAETTEERMLYSLFNADEAAHFNWLRNFITDEAVAEFLHNPFIHMLDELLRREDRTTLIYLVQILLEGWGITHYNALMNACLDENLRRVFETILKDEARHHGSGLVLFQEHPSTASQLEEIALHLASFFQMVQVGPQMIVSAIERVKGHLSNRQRAQAFAELDCEAQTAKQLKTLRSLVETAAFAGAISSRLEGAGHFRPFTASECAAVGVRS